MNDQIFETVVTTVGPQGQPHIAPMGVRYRGDTVVLMPFKPSTTLTNILTTRSAVLNVVTDTRVFAGAVTGRRDFALVAAGDEDGPNAAVRLAAAVAHTVLGLADVQDDGQRPVLTLRPVRAETHALFLGFNRAQAAVVEAAVLVSRLHMLAADKIDREMAYLQIAIDKTAGPQEHEAWAWLQQAIAAHRARPTGELAP